MVFVHGGGDGNLCLRFYSSGEEDSDVDDPSYVPEGHVCEASDDGDNDNAGTCAVSDEVGAIAGGGSDVMMGGDGNVLCGGQVGTGLPATRGRQCRLPRDTSGTVGKKSHVRAHNVDD